jgi:hypothetical protein
MSIGFPHTLNRSPHQSHNRPAAEHAEQEGSGDNEGDSWRCLPIQELECHFLPILYDKYDKRRDERGQEKKIQQSHRNPSQKCPVARPQSS